MHLETCFVHLAICPEVIASGFIHLAKDFEVLVSIGTLKYVE